MRNIISSLAVAALSLVCTPAEAYTGPTSMLASWYGPGFHGRTTANGESYNMYGFTAAHKTLPFGTKLLVCYNGCVEVRINDRGPYIGGRELDLSQGAAAQIGLMAAGVDYVDVTYL